MVEGQLDGGIMRICCTVLRAYGILGCAYDRVLWRYSRMAGPLYGGGDLI